MGGAPHPFARVAPTTPQGPYLSLPPAPRRQRQAEHMWEGQLSGDHRTRQAA